MTQDTDLHGWLFLSETLQRTKQEEEEEEEEKKEEEEEEEKEGEEIQARQKGWTSAIQGDL